jgi:hypothetical protein
MNEKTQAINRANKLARDRGYNVYVLAITYRTVTRYVIATDYDMAGYYAAYDDCIVYCASQED